MHPQESALSIVHAYLRGVFLVYGIINHEDAAVNVYLTHLPAAEVGHHLLPGHLIVVHGVHLLDGQGLVDDVRPVDGAVIHVNLDFLAQELLGAAPQDGVAVHCQAGILGNVDQRIAHRLHIGTPGPHLIVGPHLAPHGIRVEVVRHQPQRIGVHEERIALAVIHSHRTVRGHGVARQLVIETIVARQHIAVHRIVELDVAERLTIARYAVVEQAVTRQLPALVGQDGAVHQFGLFGDSVVNASFGIDMVVVAHDV